MACGLEGWLLEVPDELDGGHDPVAIRVDLRRDKAQIRRPWALPAARGGPARPL